jgi:hypothetical protein
MTKDKTNLAFNKFIKQIAFLVVVLLALALIISLYARFNFGIVLFILGIFMGIVGASLGGPAPTDLIRAPSARLEFEVKDTTNHILDRVTDRIKQSVPTYDFENVMLYAGWSTLIISIPFLIAIMA